MIRVLTLPVRQETFPDPLKLLHCDLGEPGVGADVRRIFALF